MEKKRNYDSKALLNFKFSPSQKGYAPLEVDQVFDKIIADYDLFNSMINELAAKNEKLGSKNDELKKALEKAEFDLATLKKHYDALKKTSNITDDNYKLVTKVAAYERVLHRKGIDLKKAQTDPDNC